MKLLKATEQDSAALSEFHREFHIKGLVEFKIDRQKDYFAPYRSQSDDFVTYMLKDEENKIQAAASFILRDVQTENSIQRVAHATDLRVSPNRRAILEWSQHFLPVMKELSTEKKVQHFFSSINHAETQGLNLFLRPRAMKRPLPRYYLYRKFFLTSLHGRLPWAPAPLPHVRIRPASPNHRDALLAYIIRRNQFRPFHSVWSEESFQRKMAHFKGLDLSNFLIAFDSQQNIIGCTAPWRPVHTQDWIPISYSLRAHNFRQFLKFGSLLGWTRKLSKPIRSTGFESPLKFQYLTFVNADNEDVFESLLYEAYDQVSNDEFLLYAHAEADLRLLPPEDWITSSMPHSLYAVLQPDEAYPGFLNPSINQNPEMEAAWTF